MRFTRSPVLPREVRDRWRTTLPTGAPHRAVAVAEGAPPWTIVSLDLLSVGDGEWRHTWWNTIERGGWNEDLGELYWNEYDDPRTHRVRLRRPGRVPELFNERVQASIVFSRTVPFTEERGIVISARRRPSAADRPLEWHATLQRGLSWNEPGVRETADEALARYRTEFDPA